MQQHEWGSLAAAGRITGKSNKAALRFVGAAGIRSRQLPGLRREYFLDDVRRAVADAETAGKPVQSAIA